MPENAESELARALGHIPGGLFILTAQYEGHRGAMLVKWIQQCSAAPPMVMVALATGLEIEPLIRNSRSFALCQIGEGDRYLTHKFSRLSDADAEDPLVTIMTTTAPSGSPIVDRAMAFLDCEVVRHVDLESDHRIYVGQVHSGRLLHPAKPAVHFGGNGTTPC